MDGRKFIKNKYEQNEGYNVSTKNTNVNLYEKTTLVVFSQNLSWDEHIAFLLINKYITNTVGLICEHRYLISTFIKSSIV